MDAARAAPGQIAVTKLNMVVHLLECYPGRYPEHDGGQFLRSVGIG